MPAKRTRVCSHIAKDGRSCPELVPCPVHSRPASAPWSRHREPWERAQRARLRAAALERAGGRCERIVNGVRCGCPARPGEPLQMHHVRPISRASTIADVRILCSSCHRAVDSNAR